ncbi:hypothetical protein OG379_30315 [Streptomyces sp. NBC_01166]|uniref:hypothetical protein n=1 Tax=Streptomyces sp. NBC_01166 TaxID=2903755 RepID=UPI00386978DF|nr:hypothetical protein OG379_30315 [Streptomyces sp. NBC_01166]
MTHHHKSNGAVEGDPDSGHGRGMPRRPDKEELEERVEEDRRQVHRTADRSASNDDRGSERN